MRAFVLALFIAAPMADIPAQAGHPYQIGNGASIHRLKSFLRQLGAPHKARRKTAAPRKSSDTGQQASVEKTAPGTDAKPATQETLAAAKAAAGKPVAAVQPKGKKVEQKSTASPVVTGKPKENPVSPPITPPPSGKKTAKNLKDASPKEATPVPTPAKTVTAAVAAIPLAKPEDGATTEGPSKTRPKAVVTALRPGDLLEFDRQPERIRQIISAALAMTEMDLYYAYGSNNPKNGGMDCSGTIQYLLRSQGFRDAPRQADLIYSWSKEKGTLIPANVHRIDAPELKGLRPGDLLFWSGTYGINRSISHVMMYLGTEKATRLPVMFGASSGRTYHGESRHGVSVFDFKLPRPEEKARFEGYGPIPGMFTTAEDARLPRS